MPPSMKDNADNNNTEDHDDDGDVEDEQLIDAEYKIWKKNTPYLYDFVMTHSLEWPSLTCQWLPNTKMLENFEEHNLLVGTHTNGEQNYLMVASVNLPKDEKVVQDNGDGENAPVATFSAANYDEEKNEVGGYGHAPSGSSAVGKIEVRMKIKHDGEVNRARYMPQNHFIVASRGPNPEIYIWDLSKHSSFPDDATAPTPQGVCVGHRGEGYGLCWSQHNAGSLVTCSEDKTVCLWDVNDVIGGKSENGHQMKPVSVFKGHTEVVEDVDWHHRDMNLVGSVGDDRSIRIWDIRKDNATESAHRILNAHDADINSIAFNPVNEFLLATGSSDKTVALWDMRNLKCRIQTLQGHNDQVYNVEWAPFNESILASCSSDRRVAIWDLSRIGMEQTPEDAEDGPPELLFIHGGHTSKISDISFNRNKEWTVASVSEDNVLQVWNMAEEIYADEEESEGGMENDDDDHGEEDALGDDELE